MVAMQVRGFESGYQNRCKKPGELVTQRSHRELGNDVHVPFQCRRGGDTWILGVFLPANLTGEIQVSEALSQKIRGSGGNALPLKITLMVIEHRKVELVPD